MLMHKSFFDKSTCLDRIALHIQARFLSSCSHTIPGDRVTELIVDLSRSPLPYCHAAALDHFHICSLSSLSALHLLDTILPDTCDGPSSGFRLMILVLEM